MPFFMNTAASTGGGGTTNKTASYSAVSLLSMPSSVAVSGVDTTAVYINLDVSSGGVNLTTWLPSGMVDGCDVTIRKVDGTPNKITFTDASGMNYDYIDKAGETLNLRYFQSANLFKVV